MGYREQPSTRPGIACLWSRDSATGGAALIVPDACVDVIWHRETGRLWVAGPDTGPHRSAVGPGTLVGLRFEPGHTALGVPVNELRDARVDLADLWGGRGADLADRLAHTSTLLAAQRLLLSALPSELDPAAAAIGALARRTGSVREMAERLGLGERRLHRRAVAAFGYGPKVLHRVLRFQRALALARDGIGQAEVAVRAGFADQPHLAREVRALSGESLGALVRPVAGPGQ
ncbi:helix-turn-helix domain-containing protein [Actinokineospora auranticolor]|uniref:AraC-like DNA-binding protein n=1 Tax=Actinokineospora auranticolor TaxID=155976 RepID=A0A2S6GQF0_9PSEU|nr:helix-turn-helix domain-containing protein [Actinokineospora auranticolor]PPK67400.1 AraC-like DNA-binding protein [Actinokineospora auranticolor]